MSGTSLCALAALQVGQGKGPGQVDIHTSNKIHPNWKEWNGAVKAGGCTVEPTNLGYNKGVLYLSFLNKILSEDMLLYVLIALNYQFTCSESNSTHWDECTAPSVPKHFYKLFYI